MKTSTGGKKYSHQLFDEGAEDENELDFQLVPNPNKAQRQHVFYPVIEERFQEILHPEKLQYAAIGILVVLLKKMLVLLSVLV
jgi:hypothetical protein